MNYDKCKSCPYCEKSSKRINTEFNDSTTLLVFQAPGQDEWESKTRTPVISQNPHSTAAKIRNSLKRMNKNRCDYDFAEIVRCYPDRGGNNRDKKPRVKSIKICSTYLENEICEQKYKRIIVFGKVAEEAIRSIKISKADIVYSKHPSGNLKSTELDKLLESV